MLKNQLVTTTDLGVMAEVDLVIEAVSKI